MTTAWWLVLARASALVALGTSAALYVQYIDPVAATFCGLDSGCEAVRGSGMSYFGVRYLNVPLVGLVAYATVFAVSLRAPSSLAFVRLAGAGALIAVGLIGLQQFFVGRFCALCVAVDVAALVVALGAVMHRRAGDASDPLVPAAWVVLAALAVASPPLFTLVRPAPPVPGLVARLYVHGKVNVVEFADFECPFCRKLHPVLKEVLDDYPNDAIHFVRINVPLPMHPNAEPASRAYLCAKAQGKGEEMADRLVAIELDPGSIRRAAVGVGLDPAAFDKCWSDPRTAAAVAREAMLFEQAGLRGLPTTFVEGERLIGAVDAAALRDAFERAREGETARGVPGPVYFGLVAALALAVAWFGRSRRATLEDAGQRA